MRGMCMRIQYPISKVIWSVIRNKSEVIWYVIIFVKADQIVLSAKKEFDSQGSYRQEHTVASLRMETPGVEFCGVTLYNV